MGYAGDHAEGSGGLRRCGITPEIGWVPPRWDHAADPVSSTHDDPPAAPQTRLL
jgi:hypothetical protein